MTHLTNELTQEISRIVNSKCCEGYPYNKYCQSIHDWNQTHAVYGVMRDEVNDMKASLKSLGAKNFRIQKTRKSECTIVCFNGIDILTK